jgi:NTP pyrophosphatase (non-canonical NTP hydrolase)|tara:strand:+ start:4610 stop:4891 length:282 start_codon:yes stop_codon:yes gene_type:complete
MKQFKKLIEENYKSIVDRGLITPETKYSEFVDKLCEEVDEVEMAYYETIERSAEEIADIILTALNMAKHLKIDIVSAMEDKVLINQQRADERF